MIRNIYILLLLSLSYSQPSNFSYNSTTTVAMYYFELVSIDGIPIVAGEDWVGAFNGEVCVGASQCGSGICSVPVMGYDGMAHSEGYMQNGDIPSFKICDSSENVYYNAIPSEDIPWENFAFNIIDSLTVFRDCLGELGGMAYEDNCGLCDDNPENDCPFDCHGVPEGEAFIDDCGICSGGYSGHVANSDMDCNGVCFGDSYIDECGVCGGDNTSCEIPGDMNGDGQINVIDIVMAVDLILNNNYDVVGDVNEDGQLNVIDIVMLVDWVLNGMPEADSDGDGVLDEDDSDPNNPYQCSDVDGDACEDCSTGTFNPSDDGADNESDGICDAGDDDDDNDGCLDVDDDASLEWDDDYDADGTPDDCDSDDDDDGAADPADSDDNNEFECSDVDGDTCDDCSTGTFNPSDDGYDYDGDGHCDDGDPDDDNDGCLDWDEPCDGGECGELDLLQSGECSCCGNMELDCMPWYCACYTPVIPSGCDDGNNDDDD